MRTLPDPTRTLLLMIVQRWLFGCQRLGYFRSDRSVPAHSYTSLALGSAVRRAPCTDGSLARSYISLALGSAVRRAPCTDGSLRSQLHLASARLRCAPSALH